MAARKAKFAKFLRTRHAAAEAGQAQYAFDAARGPRKDESSVSLTACVPKLDQRKDDRAVNVRDRAEIDDERRFGAERIFDLALEPDYISDVELARKHGERQFSVHTSMIERVSEAVLRKSWVFGR